MLINQHIEVVLMMYGDGFDDIRRCLNENVTAASKNIEIVASEQRSLHMRP